MSIYKGDSLPYIKESIKSVLHQTFSSFDFLIKIDGFISTEVNDYLNSIDDKRVNLFFRNENKGLAHSLNELIEYGLKKDYQFFIRMDADDISLPERFQKQIEFMESNLDIDCCGTWLKEIDEFENEFFEKKMPVTSDECKAFFKKRNCMNHPTVVIRRTFFEKAGLYPTNTILAEDMMLWTKGHELGLKFYNIPEYLILFRVTDSFYVRRRGVKYAYSILKNRIEINKRLGFGFDADIYAILNFVVKSMPPFIIKYLYKTAR
ncbi:glycosyltransferase [Aureibacter tunicatorum]|uniref:Glycosyltransferase involved in cell wall biosynthesis n=1 Tax=Aureibacter tunicatorum TaxID=866807 RepID=A0AAE3XQ71_9BACT|nr:glycosyltransferase [Aureibacter tunicatorum]MDR6240693.1 glycosyltransferase involved in cell wall biosynthesis [Aureibacter tunicatorum]BDD06974.1 glycosyl transferase [Aureibacter tunicatorum]